MASARIRPGLVPEEVDVARVLAFVNTLSARPTDAPVERLVSFEALVEWAREAGILRGDDGERLVARGRRRPAGGARIVRQVCDLRERLHDTFSAMAAGRAPGPPTLAALGARLARWYPHGHLAAAGDHLEWVAPPGDDLDWLLWEISRAAVRLVTSPRLGRLRACAADDCGWWFLDETKNASRRWCDMKICGNRDKVRRFRERQRA